MVSNKKTLYVLAGLWNTAFAYLFFYLEYLWFGTTVNYIILLVISQVVGLTNAFIVHKHIVFKSKGHWLREYLRYYVVYSGALAANLALVICMVELLNFNPVVSQIFVGLVLTVATYIAHNKFSFGK